MIQELFWSSWWPGLLLWVALYVSDYLCTIISVRAYRARAAGGITYEGSFELTPYFQADIDSLRWVSPRFIYMLVRSSAALLLIWWLTHRSPEWSAAYEIVLGSLVLLEVTVHTRHLRNLYQFRTAFGPDGIRGNIYYPRAVMLRLSAFEMLVFAGLYLVLFLFTGSWFLLGGVPTCLVTARRQAVLAKKARNIPQPPGGIGKQIGLAP